MPEEKREWLTEGEIKSIAKDEAQKVLQTTLDRHTALLEKIADGAQAQINSAYILHGDVTIGLEGFVPMVNRRMGNIEAGQIADRAIVESHHNDNSMRFSHIEERLSQVEDSTHRIRRIVLSMCRSIMNGSDGKLDWAKIGAFTAAIGGIMHILYAHLSWSAIKRILLSISHTFV